METRFSAVSNAKSTGATYTPPALARFVAREMVAYVRSSFPDLAQRVVCLDPAAGDGELLLQLGTVLRAAGYTRLALVGCEIDEDAARIATARLTRAGFRDVDIRVLDFLGAAAPGTESNRMVNLGPLFANNVAQCSVHPPDVQVLIANPPYVRTQVLGAEQARALATEHDLTGRVDLYQAFIARISDILRPGAVAGVITSNRFLSTRGGESLRRLLSSRFEIAHVWDLGDTKLFSAAVLPAVTLMTRASDNVGVGRAGMTTVYGTPECPVDQSVAAVDCITLALSNSGVFRTQDGRFFEVRQGRVSADAVDGGVWRLENDQTEAWLQMVLSRTWKTFADVGKIRVGIKTTADDVFIIESWDDPGSEPELLRPLVTHHVGRRWKGGDPIKRVVYPHAVVGKKRVAIPLDDYPRTAAYLNRHRVRLEGREYVRKAKRMWYEIWVPQDPRLWSRPKLVFRDIADTPQFWIETRDVVVNGDCYWMVLDEGQQDEVLWLALGVANTKFIEDFYDRKFNNKLYAGRRRFITQYVNEFPLPNPDSEEAPQIAAAARTAFRLADEMGADADREIAVLQDRIDALVRAAFGVQAGGPL